MLYCLCGEEFYLINKKEQELLDNLKIDNIIRYNFETINLMDIILEVQTVDLFNERKLVIVSNFSLSL